MPPTLLSVKGACPPALKHNSNGKETKAHWTKEKWHLSVGCARVLSVVSKLLSVAEIPHCVCRGDNKGQDLTSALVPFHRFLASATSVAT